MAYLIRNNIEKVVEEEAVIEYYLGKGFKKIDTTPACDSTDEQEEVPAKAKKKATKKNSTKKEAEQ